MVVDGPRGFLTTSGILPFNVKLKPLCMGNRVGRRGKFVAGLLEKAVGDQGVERGNKQPMVSASYECTTIDMEMRRLLRCRGLLTKHYKDEFNIPKGTHPGPDMVEVGWGSTSHCMGWKPGSIFLLMPSCASRLTPMV
ncbi:hypothetical protein Gogos_010039 [Gossypium gossypioides]|uniref:Uncharacterized protein n=1 Tax=Gossypium gossypioides TaxID=34282 RepID=A0A7J9BJW6_GOSGO|nr:hypothetical protein [Gossypium gossypioides]